MQEEEQAQDEQDEQDEQCDGDAGGRLLCFSTVRPRLVWAVGLKCIVVNTVLRPSAQTNPGRGTHKTAGTRQTKPGAGADDSILRTTAAGRRQGTEHSRFQPFAIPTKRFKILGGDHAPAFARPPSAPVRRKHQGKGSGKTRGKAAAQRGKAVKNREERQPYSEERQWKDARKGSRTARTGSRTARKSSRTARKRSG